MLTKIGSWVALLVSLLLATGCPGVDPPGRGVITAAWANDGGDKVTRDERRASLDPDAVVNSVWDGETIRVFGARNEVVAFNLVLEAPAGEHVPAVSVSLDSLIGPDGTSIGSAATSRDNLFDFVGRNIELFYVRYLQIQGLSVDLAYDVEDERQVPEDCQLPYDEEFNGIGGWADRHCADRFYPDIAVPLELVPPFTIPAGSNQSIWIDIFIPQATSPGTYAGAVIVQEGDAVTYDIPVALSVRDFTLPDIPSAKTMLYCSTENINDRYLGQVYVGEPGDPGYRQSLDIADRHFQLAHRHRISMIDEHNEFLDSDLMEDAWTARLTGELFTHARGYDGPGVGVGNGVCALGTYGDWQPPVSTQAQMWTIADAWVNWFEEQAFATPTEYFLFLHDEPSPEEYPQVQQWAEWINENPGPGGRIKSLVTVSLPDAMAEMPDLDIVTSGSGVGITSEWEAALSTLRADPTKQFFEYGGTRPATGSVAIEDDGVALRTLGWAQYKKGADRWFVWESTYYVNFQCLGYVDEAQTNVFQQAQTFGCYDRDDSFLGRAGWNYLNGDGVLFYPGTDQRYPGDSYDVPGPFASLRLKHWRRGIQDVDYLTLAAEVDPDRVQEIVYEVVPTVLWEYGVTDPAEPTWVNADISWSTDPDDWERARAELAEIIERGQ